MREYIYFVGWAVVVIVAVVFFDIEGAWIMLAAVLGIVWLALKIITDHQEKKLGEELGEMTEEEYESFLDDAEKEGLVTRSPGNKDD